MNSIFTQNNASATLPFVRVACYGAATFLLGRKIYHLVGFLGCRIGSKLASLMKYAEQETNLKSAGDSFSVSLKNNLSRDLTMITGLVAVGLATEKAEDSLARALANRSADELIQEGKSIAKTAYKNTSMLAARTYRDVFGDNRYPLERIRDSISEINYVKNLLIENLKTNFRITRPYSAPLFKNAVETFGAVCQEKVRDCATVSKDKIIETSSVVNVVDFARILRLLSDRREMTTQ